ncbi:MULTISPECIES: holo-ACP synthase [Staphylococcus]|uniref:Holo-[acyl-carrier-protein] synthase n=1 Tax=Staphylococcus agnetis TaxID=985762 RepID=A0A242VEJ1_9STAP|nr:MULTISPECIES: holo-ACP synthase [Staphylococcus]ALN76961.1 holo-ACP synthase [Staphylococcus agnetis]MBY7664952.1 holo-ACP synthase [Staphylococcus agnetis]MCO4326271.1 holo-ACP synthase [Staphylococcus agnetis]MCO4338792.1 holo-ACP synthase [Staphylococcus agnetis]MCO4340602.1 holo-ACP synthase [Staphylococcus agnetis]
MIYGIGIDLVEINRLKEVLKRQARFPERILSAKELERFNSFKLEKRQLEFLAGRFACKEAMSKALGTGLGENIAFKDIHCENDQNGKPTIAYKDFTVHVSISHTEHYAVSQVIIEQ